MSLHVLRGQMKRRGGGGGGGQHVIINKEIAQRPCGNAFISNFDERLLKS